MATKIKGFLATCGKSHLIYFFMFLFFLYIGFSVPIGGDDWEISSWYSGGAISAFLGSVRGWSYISGRIVHRFIASCLDNYLLIWAFVSALVHVATVYFLAKILNMEKKIVPIILMFAMMLSVSKDMRREIHFHVNANTAYTMCILFVFIYLCYLFSEDKIRWFDSVKLNAASFCFLSIFTCLWLENVTATILMLNLIIVISSILKRRPCSIYVYSGLVGSIIGSIIMFTSVGVHNRIESSTSAVGYIHRIINNIPTMLFYLVSSCLGLWLIYLIACFFFYTKQERRWHTVIKQCGFLSFAAVIAAKLLLSMMCEKYFPISPIVVSYLNRLTGTELTAPSDLARGVAMYHPFAVVFAICLLLSPMVIIFDARLAKHREKLIYLYLTAFFSAGCVTLSPSARTTMLALWFLIGLTGLIISKLKIESKDARKITLIFVAATLLLRMEYYVYIIEETRPIKNLREELISDYRIRQINGQLSENDVLVLPAYSDEMFFSLNAASSRSNSFYYGPFKRYYGLADDSELLFDDGFLIEDLILTQESDTVFTVELIQNELMADKEYEYWFVIKRDSRDYLRTEESDGKEHTFDVVYSGTYGIVCYVRNISSGEVKTVTYKENFIVE